MTEQPLGIAFIGAGEIAALHVEALSQIPQARFCGYWNRWQDQPSFQAEAYGGTRYQTVEALICDPSVDAVFVLTNLETHLNFAELALNAGKHVLVEKPVGATVAEIESLRKTAQRVARFCVPGHNMIHEASIARARDLIQTGAIGEIVSVYVLYNIYHSDERAATLPGMVRHILTHNVYTMLYLAGAPRRVSAMKAVRNHPQPDKEDLAMALIELKNGGLAHLCASFAADDLAPAPWTFTVKVIGTAGTTHYTYQDWVQVKKGSSHSHTYTAYQATITAEDRYFVEICREGKSPLSSLDDAIMAQKVIEACERSIAEGITVSIV